MSVRAGYFTTVARMAGRSDPVAGLRHGQIRSVQGLRAVAALLVVVFHSTVLWHDRFDPASRPWEPGNSGVDLFFVISGLIMVVSSQKLIAAADGWRRFITLRLIRVVPIYWLATTAKLAAVLAVPAMALHTRPSVFNVVASYLFVPSRDGAGVVRPVLDVGWTLSFEMLFYLAFTAALFLRVGPGRVVSVAMVALALLSIAVRGVASPWATLANPIVLEFVFGLAIGTAVVSGRMRGSLVVSALIVAAGCACLVVVPVAGWWERTLVWGVPAGLILYACVACDRQIGPSLPAGAVLLGEASYSLYLTHGFVLPVVGWLLARSPLVGGVLEAAVMAGCVLGSVAVALLAYVWLERPLTGWLRRVSGERRSVLGAAESPL